MSYRVLLTRPASEQGQAISDWWALNRTKAPDLFDEELAWALSYLEHAPLTGARIRGRHRHPRRLLLQKTRYHVYYTVEEAIRQVDVIAVWHAARGSGPNV